MRLAQNRLEDNTIEGRTFRWIRGKFHEIWIEQCDAAQDIKLRYGLKAAFDYLVAREIVEFRQLPPSDHPEFARELPRFVSRVRRMFTPQEIRTHLARIEREQSEYDATRGRR